eukprot:2535649-Pleurochrysis_carterae.AAC.1
MSKFASKTCQWSRNPKPPRTFEKISMHTHGGAAADSHTRRRSAAAENIDAKGLNTERLWHREESALAWRARRRER